ncbi:MAG: hypothetical protein AB3N16_09275 [Flavobacteriaceae bacterium]
MKNLRTLCALLALPLMGCPYPDDGPEPAGSSYTPVTMHRDAFEASVGLQPVTNITTSGKIYVKDHLLFINEVNSGFHVFDNSDPKNPIATKFASIPGATDMAIRDNIIYVNQATDLIAIRFDLGNDKAHITKRIRNVFPEMPSPDGYYAYNIPANHVVVNWTLKK